jgi:hypothetical protein
VKELKNKDRIIQEKDNEIVILKSTLAFEEQISEQRKQRPETDIPLPIEVKAEIEIKEEIDSDEDPLKLVIF